jgi:hypothetical protein
MRLRSLTLVILLMGVPLAAQEWTAGVEANQTASYSYLTHSSRRPAGANRQLVIWQTASYLQYRVRDGAGTTRVQSPGLAAGAMLRWNLGDVQAGAGAGWEVRWTTRDPGSAPKNTRTQTGPVLNGDLAVRLDPRTTASLAAQHSGAIDWSSVSSDLRYAVTPAIRIGPQAIWQGNDDLRVMALGGVLEVPFEGTSLQIRGGQARVRHRNGTRETEPYLSVGLAHRF